MNDQQVPTVGRIVRYARRDGGREHAAIIADVVDLVVGTAPDGERITEQVVDLDIVWGHRAEDMIPEDFDGWWREGDAETPGTWYWPERPVPRAAEVPVQTHEKPQKLGFVTYPGGNVR